ncbi:MAG: hypothetical protein RLZ84_12 [Actinomycetota bacterium]
MSSKNDLLHDDGRPSFTVAQFVDVLNQVMKQAFDGGVWVEGEIEGLKQTGPNMYFTLVEQSSKGKMTLNVNLFRNDLSRVNRKLSEQGLELKNGMKVKLQGSPDYYGPFGKLSLIARDVDTTFTLGDLALKREELLRKLRDSGVTEKNKRRPLPLVPLRLGIISSAEAAGWADARQHLSESGIAFHVNFCAVRVQGEQAAPMVVQALDYFSQRADIDIVLLMRGGGSKSDLAAFDEESIALAIARCQHPVFTGIGHQVDRSIADEVAHTACKTPTACADAVIEHVSSFLVDLQDTAARIANGEARKVVLARGIDVKTDRPVDPSALLSQLRRTFPASYLFSFDGFVGATPEMLVQRDGEIVRAHPMAGTAPRSGDAETDARLAAALLASTNTRDEHRHTIDMVHETLLPWCSYLDEEDEPSIVAVANVQHLSTRLEGRLSAPPASVIELVDALHPTPAVGGSPRGQALQIINEVEQLDRGRYAGPVGWVDNRGNGTWAVGIRSAQINGDTTRIYAGVGVVIDSIGEIELAETRAKLQAMLGALVRP